jgi:type III secretion protein O
MSIFKQLLRIREFREQRAQAAVTAEQAALRRAVEVRDAASSELDAFKDYAKARENRLFEELQGRAVLVRDIHDVRYAVGEMKAKERGYARVLEQAEVKRTTQSQVLAEARTRHQEADRTLQKIVERVAIDQTEDAQSQERGEETEREDVVKTNHTSRDGDGTTEARDA